MVDLDDLTMSLACLRDDPFTCTRDDLEHIVQASGDAGFRGASLWSTYADQLASEGCDRKAILRLCARHGVQVRMVEAVTSWSGADRSTIADESRAVFALASDLGAEEVLAVSFDEAAIDLDLAARGFAYLCDLAARHGLRIGLEFLPWSGLPDLRTAAEVVHRAGCDNGGLVIDSWHWQRQPGGPDLSTLRSLPADRIHVLQLNDASAVAEDDLSGEAMQGRLLPGDGNIDLRLLIETIDEIGAEPIVGPEVFNRDLARLGPQAAAQLVGDATRRVLAR